MKIQQKVRKKIKTTCEIFSPEKPAFVSAPRKPAGTSKQAEREPCKSWAQRSGHRQRKKKKGAWVLVRGGGTAFERENWRERPYNGQKPALGEKGKGHLSLEEGGEVVGF